ncbi:MAG TPA: hypothetical protein VG844_00410 [Terracidiphilus sp.]|nr:hypothetical protein [Terracidiphilus sp.]
MKVQCIATTGKALLTKFLVGYCDETVFNLTLGAEYTVFAFSVYGGASMLLLAEDNTDLPNWYPIDLFTISDAQVPRDWYCAAYPGNGEVLQFLMGYERIVRDEAHYDGLLERLPEDLETFQMEKAKSESAS